MTYLPPKTPEQEAKTPSATPTDPKTMVLEAVTLGMARRAKTLENIKNDIPAWGTNKLIPAIRDACAKGATELAIDEGGVDATRFRVELCKSWGLTVHFVDGVTLVRWAHMLDHVEAGSEVEAPPKNKGGRPKSVKVSDGNE